MEQENFRASNSVKVTQGKIELTISVEGGVVDLTPQEPTPEEQTPRDTLNETPKERTDD